MTEVRTTSATGGEKGTKPERYDLLPKEGLDAMARVYAFGATKYADHNWRRGYEWSKSIAAAMRHLMAFADGETNDPESGEPHPAHVMFHMAALLTWLEEQGEGETNAFDDRWPHLMERARQESAAAEEARLLAEQEEPVLHFDLLQYGPDTLSKRPGQPPVVTEAHFIVERNGEVHITNPHLSAAEVRRLVEETFDQRRRAEEWASTI